MKLLGTDEHGMHYYQTEDGIIATTETKTKTETSTAVKRDDMWYITDPTELFFLSYFGTILLLLL